MLASILSFLMNLLRRSLVVLLVNAALLTPVSTAYEIAEEEQIEQVTITSSVRPGISPSKEGESELATNVRAQLQVTVDQVFAEVPPSLLYLLLCELILYD